MARSIRNLELDWEEMPLPEGVDAARVAFLHSLPTAPAPGCANHSPCHHSSRWRRPYSLVAAAASVLLGVGLAALMFFSGPRADASSEIVERLLDWNLDLAQSTTLAERRRIYEEKAAEFQNTSALSQSSPEDQRLAETLLKNSLWLAEHDDPSEESVLFDELADTLMVHVQAARRRGNDKEMGRFAGRYARVAEYGVSASLKRAEESGAPDFDQKRLERVHRRSAHRKHILEALLEQAPDLTRAEIKKALEGHRRRGNKK